MAVNDVASAQGVILGELGTQFGGMAQAEAKAFSGQLVQLQNTWGDVMEDFGRHLAQSGVMAEMIQWAKDMGEAYAWMFPGSVKPDFKPFQDEIEAVRVKLTHYQNQVDSLTAQSQDWAAITKQAGEEGVGFEDVYNRITSTLNRYTDILIINERKHLDLINRQKEVEEFNRKEAEWNEIKSEFTEAEIKDIDIKTQSLGEYIKTVQSSIEIEEIGIRKLTALEQARAANKKISEKAQIISDSKIASSFASLSEAMGADAKITQALTLTQAIADTYAGANKAFAQGGVLGFATGSAVVAAGLANVIQIRQAYKEQNAQYGFEGMVTEPTQFTVGEGGAAEYVSVQPLEGVNNAGGQGVTVNISGNVMTQDFVESELSERIQEAVRKGVSFA